jgi:HTH-type transcriptional regulator, competence development regulator
MLFPCGAPGFPTVTLVPSLASLRPVLPAGQGLKIYCNYPTMMGMSKQEGPQKQFGERLRELRKAKNLSQRALAQRINIDYTYLSKVESERLDFAQYPSEGLIRKLAEALDADVDELLLLAKKIPPDIRDRVIERPDAFRKIASVDDKTLNEILKQIERKERDK